MQATYGLDESTLASSIGWFLMDLTRSRLRASPILPMTQHADEGKFLPLFTNHRKC
jgi:hypothetical protein